MTMLLFCFLGFFSVTALLLIKSGKKSSRKKDPDEERKVRFRHILADPALQARSTLLSDCYHEVAPVFNAATQGESFAAPR
jgi:hypothetical protein